MVAEKAHEIVVLNEIQLARLHGLYRQFVRFARYNRVQTEDLTWLCDSQYKGLSFAGSCGELCLSLTKYKDSTRCLPFHKYHCIFREDGGMLYPVEGLERLL